MIWFVGAGCYHPDMLTIGAIKCLKMADCVLYDHLVNPEFLQYTSAECECICVGKRGYHPSFLQTDIEKLLVEKDKTYSNVVRLKGGDPFLFARGSEEMRYVLDHGCDCQYVPGISSAIGALGFAGIPVTQRYVSTGFVVHTLHTQDGKDPLDYTKIAQEKNTQIFFMGSHKIEQLVKNCLAHGMAADTPIALGSHLTYPHQKVLVSSLGKLLDQDLSAYTSPLLIVIGDVVKEQAYLENAARLPLFSKQVLFCSVDQTPWPIEDLTLRYGIYPTVRQVAEVKTMIEEKFAIEPYSTFVFVSRHAVEGFFENLKTHHLDVRDLYQKKIVAIGARTQEALQQRGLLCDRVFSHFQAFEEEWQDKSSVCMIKAKENEYAYPSFSCYCVDEKVFAIPEVLWDAVAVTCSRSLEILKNKGLDLSTPIFCFAHKTLQKAKEWGFTNLHPTPSSKQELVEELIRFLGETS